jgi:hypothetical protein
MNFVCEFCKKELSTKGNLLLHKRTAKFCLEIQGKTIEDFKCNYCSKKFTSSQHLNEHYNSCKLKKKEDQKISEEKMKIEYDDKIKIINDDHKRDIAILNFTIEKLEKKLENYEKRLFEMASRPTNTNNANKTVVINTNVPLTNEVLRQCADTFSIENAKNINGITKHFTESLEDHITCQDSSRNIFKYTNEKDEEIIDADLENILPQYLTVIKDKNDFLYREVFDYFKANNVSLSEQTDYNIFYNALNCIINKKGDQSKYTEKMKRHIVRQCKKQFLEKNKNKEKEIIKELSDEEIMMLIIREGGSLYQFVDRVFDIDEIDNETDEQFEYRRKMEDLFKQRRKEFKFSAKI